MKLFDHPIKAQFLDRPNRFLIRCKYDGRTISAALPNPGRMQELLLPGSTVYLDRGNPTPLRKTAYTVIGVERERRPVMLHTLRTNDVARHLLEKCRVPGLEGARLLKSEFRIGHSRFDFLLEQRGQKIVLEVKSCTLVGKRVAMFPDAVTERGARHLSELAALTDQGLRSVVLFIVHWPHARIFMPDYHTDLCFAETLLSVRNKVEVIPLAVGWGRDLSFLPRVERLTIPWAYIEREASDRGSYLLILKLRRDRNLHVGALGKLFFRKGYYLYVGSAMANLQKRMERHRRLRKRHHWHIDDLRAAAEYCSVLPIRSSERLECEVAYSLSRIGDWSIPRFGCSDCSCETHLFGMSTPPLQSPSFHRLLQHFRMDRYGTETPSE